MKKLSILLCLVLVVALVGCEKKPVVEEPVSGNQVVTEVETPEKAYTKVDESKDLIYSTNYDAEFKAESYTVGDETYYSRDLIVPVINIDTDYAQKSAAEMKEEFEKVVKHYNDGVEDGMSYVEYCTYDSYVSDDVLSVKFYYGLGATDVVHPKYFTYNMNLKEAMPLLYEEACEYCGISKDEIQSKVENAIRDYFKEQMDTFEQDEIDKYINQSIDSYNESVTDYTLNYCISKEGKLQVVVNLKIPAGTGEFDTLFTIE